MIRIDAVHLQRLWVQFGTLERSHMQTDGAVTYQVILFIAAQEYRGDLEQGMTAAIEAAGFDVYHHRQEAAKAVGHGAVVRI